MNKLPYNSNIPFAVLAYVVQIVDNTLELIFVIIYGYIIFALVWRACGRAMIKVNHTCNLD